jgi:hypothetical protein
MLGVRGVSDENRTRNLTHAKHMLYTPSPEIFHVHLFLESGLIEKLQAWIWVSADT